MLLMTNKKKSEKEESKKGIVSSAVDGLKIGVLAKVLKKIFGNFFDDIQKHIYETQNRIMKKVTDFFLMMIGIIFIVLALVFFIKEHFELGWGNTFFIIGMSIIFISLLLKVFWEKSKK